MFRGLAELYNLDIRFPLNPSTKRLCNMRLPHLLKFFCALNLASLAMPVFSASDDDLAKQLLTQALDNQYHGKYQASLELVNDLFPMSRDSLTGHAEFADDAGERRITLAGGQKSFEYHSLNFGKEQWITDETSHRIRRIANRQWKKGVFGTLLTYEDMVKFPSDFFLEYSSCRGVKTNDSTYEISMTLKPVFQSFYSRLEVTLSKSPVLLKGLTFFGPQEQKLKTMEVRGYKEYEGKWLATDMAFANCDSLSTLKMCFKNFTFPESPLVQKDKAKNAGLSFLSKLSSSNSDGVDAAAKEEAEDASGEVSN